MLAACRRAAQTASVDYPRLVYPYIEKEVSLATPIPIQRLCQLGEVSRAGFYRRRHAPPAEDTDLDLRDEVQRIALEWPCYGWRRVTAELRRRGWTVNHKRVRRILREDNLLCLRRRKFVVTTDSNHNRPVYPNLAASLVLTGIDQLWIADITYIRLETEFVYLAVVLDAYSRRAIGWALDRTLEDDLALAALRMALGQRSPAPGLVHHSDRGIQYASADYTDLLKEHGITISMSRKGNPYDKAYASHCTSSVRCATTSPADALFDSLTPCAFRGALAPGCSYKQSFLPL
jgi:putative transposase